jgi:DNA-binding response OmpR family regulator
MTEKPNAMHIAIVEDDVILREELTYFLSENGFVVTQVNNGSSLDELLMYEPIKIIVLDLNLPGQNGLDIAKRIRASFPNLGIIMLTARTGLVDRIKGYENGADIYLPKPTPALELLAAIKSLERRLGHADQPERWSLDPVRRHLTAPGAAQSIALTAIEVYLLLALASAPNHTLGYEAIQELLKKKYDFKELTKRALENVISRLRKKISQAVHDDKIRCIQSVWATGYQLCLPIVVLSINE